MKVSHLMWGEGERICFVRLEFGKSDSIHVAWTNPVDPELSDGISQQTLF